ncbi:hypothetical protein NDN08_008297 [Rhodosorus marinus]|uniref:Uncharacterized protein n=1 Tax=Rhodosorus marinus TaxID=101924 RepID=A0AAV8V0C6_9RHOD|nr:hypothetical protein NDN08_008297 [Rhodosorus marinus]
MAAITGKAAMALIVAMAIVGPKSERNVRIDLLRYRLFRKSPRNRPRRNVPREIVKAMNAAVLSAPVVRKLFAIAFSASVTNVTAIRELKTSSVNRVQNLIMSELFVTPRIRRKMLDHIPVQAYMGRNARPTVWQYENNAPVNASVSPVGPIMVRGWPQKIA